MTGRFHLVKDIKDQCPYCGREIKNDWKSQFEIEMHYKRIKCACGKENVVKVDFLGSGHDDWTSLEHAEEDEDSELDELVESEHKAAETDDSEEMSETEHETL